VPRARPLAIVHETGTQWTASKLAKKLKPRISRARLALAA